MPQNQERPAGPRATLWLWFLLPMLAYLVLLGLPSAQTENLDYSDFRRQLIAGKLDNLAIGPDIIEGSVRASGASDPKTGQPVPARRFSTVRVYDPDLIDALEGAGVHYTGTIKSQTAANLLSWMLPIGLLLMFSGYLSSKGVGGGFAFNPGKSRARIYSESKTGVKFADVAGVDEAKAELSEIVDFLKYPQRYQKLGGRIPKGVLIVAAPGTGKTLLAKALAGEAGVPFFSISGSEFVELFVGVGAARVRDLFAQALAKAPCIVFIDELDALGKARGIGAMAATHSEQEQTLNQLLVEMDGFDPNSGVIILAATNRPEVLDPALLRPGRFDRHVALDRPDLRGRLDILNVHAKNVPLAGDVDLKKVAAQTAGFAGADLANLVNEAALHAARLGHARVDASDVDEALDRIVAGLEKRSRIISPDEKHTVAYHEAGHALTAQFRAHADRVAKISIIPRGIMALGYTQQLPAEDRYLLRRSELLDRLDVLLGGRVAEELALGDISTGAQNDLQNASDLARQMVRQYGMSERLGLATFEDVRSPFLNPAATAELKPYSDTTAETIDAEVKALLDQAHARVRATLEQHRGLLDSLAKLLLERETVDRAALDALIGAQAEDPRPALARD